jgi:nucleotide-binding universal stress UspA family protein
LPVPMLCLQLQGLCTAPAGNRGCDLIVMASHGLRGVSRLILGSHATRVLTHSAIPMLICK